MRELLDMDLLREYARERDAEAFAEIVRRHAGMVYHVARRMTGNTQDAEDVTQTCFLELARKAGEIRSSLGGWLHRAATFRAADSIRAEDRRAQHEKAAAGVQSQDKCDATFQEIQDMVDEALEKLPEELREVVVMHFLGGKTQGQIAAELKLDQSTVSRRISKGVAELRELMEKQGMVVGSVEAMCAMLVAHGSGEAPAALVAALGKLALAGVSSSSVAVPVGGAIVSKATWTASVAAVVLFLTITIGVVAVVVNGRGATSSRVIPSTGAVQMNKVIAGVPALRWGKSGETTFCGAMAAALAPLGGGKTADAPVRNVMDRALNEKANLAGPAYDYATLMGTTGLAFRVRWFRTPTKQMWTGACAVGEQLEERELLGQAIGKRLSVRWAYPKNPERSEVVARIVASIDASRPVLCYVTPHLDVAAIHGYGDGGRNFLVRDYYAGPEVQPASKLGGFFVFLDDAPGPAISPREALICALAAGVRNFSRMDHPSFDEENGSVFFYGDEGYKQWIADLKNAQTFPTAERQRLFDVSNWNFNVFNDARWTAVEYLKTAASQLVEGQARAALERAAGIYEEEARLTGRAWETKDVFLGPWTGKKLVDWTADVRRREIAMLEKCRELDRAAIGELQKALGDLTSYRLRAFAPSDWPMLVKLADAALPGKAEENRQWAEARQTIDEQASPRRHYVIEDTSGGDVVAYGAIEADAASKKARIFLVGPSRVLSVAADDLMRQLAADAKALGVETLWAREWASDMPLQAIFSQQGFRITGRVAEAERDEMVMMERKTETGR